MEICTVIYFGLNKDNQPLFRIPCDNTIGTITDIENYQGKYNYGSIKFEEESDGAKLVFDYDILENTTSIDSEELESSDEFHTAIGDILMDIIGSEIGRGDDFLREPSEEIVDAEE